MPVLLFFSALLIVVVLVIYKLVNNGKTPPMLPGQKEIVLELIRELKTCRIDVVLADLGGEKHSASLNLFEARFYLDGKKELAHERFDHLPVFFDSPSSQVIHFKKFFSQPVFPVEIREELLHFQNTVCEPVKADYPYFIMLTDIQEHDDSDSDAGLFRGNGRAFASWLAFKECADNLNYVIGQWIREHEKIADSELHAEFL